MKKMKRFLVTLLSSLTAIACVAGITACNDKKDAATDSSASPSINITIDKNEGNETICAHEMEYKRFDGSTCDQPGMALLTCTKCGETFGDVVDIPAAQHAITTVLPKAATCVTEGNKGYVKCVVCGLFNVGGAWIEGNEADYVIPATGHNMTCLVSSEAKDSDVAKMVANKKLVDCKADAYSEEFYYCSVQYAAAINSVEYKLLKNNDAQAAYLFTSGLVHTVGYEVEEAAHDFVDFFTEKDAKTGKVVTLKPSCLVEGLNNFKYCKYCTEGVDKVDTKSFKAIKDFFTADADEDGVVDVVSQGFDAAIVAATGHNFKKLDGTSTFVAGTQATCAGEGKDGTEWYGLCQNANCDVDNGLVNCDKGSTIANPKAKVITAPKHDIEFKNEDSKKATCSEKAFCGVCGEYYGELAAHKTVDVAAAAATCDVAGNTAGKYCTVCDYNTVVVIPALGHKFEAKNIQKETAEEDYVCGETYVKEDYVICSTCEDAVAVVEYKAKDKKEVKSYELAEYEDVVALREHDLDWNKIHEDSEEDYEDNKHKATCDKAGVAIKVWCNNCGDWDDEEEEFEGDWYSYKEEAFNHVETSDDGYEYTVDDDEIVVSHKVIKVDYTKATSCDEAVVCELCDKETAGTLAHTWEKDEDGKYVITVEAATCTSNGVAPYVECEECGALAWVKDYTKYLNGTALDKCIALTVIDEDGNEVEVDEDLLETETIPHEFVEIKDGREATCTKVGYTITVWECKHCGAIDETKLAEDVDVDDITIEMKDHASQNEGSCLEEVKCDTCDEMINNNAGDHAYGTDGVCKVCGALCAHNYNAENECDICHNIKKED